jgi:hypothetical protein
MIAQCPVPEISICFAVVQLAVIQGASDERILNRYVMSESRSGGMAGGPF